MPKVYYTPRATSDRRTCQPRAGLGHPTPKAGAGHPAPKAGAGHPAPRWLRELAR
jgi:hypothetical protein